MSENIDMSDELQEEYDRTFDDEQKVTNVMKLDSSSFKLSLEVVDFDSLVIPEPISKSRKETVQGLTTMVGELGILYPIQVMYTEGYKEWLEEGHSREESYDGAKYILLDGFRRVYAGYRNKLTRCNALCWNFKDGEKGNEIFLILSRVLNRQQNHSWEEIWLLYNTLMSQTTLTDGTADYLLQLNMGDTSKLKAIMDGKSMFPEPYDDLVSNKKTLQQAYNMLEKMRKEVDVLSQEDQQGISKIDTVEGVVGSADKNVLSDSEVKEILEMDEGTSELSDEAFGGMLENGDSAYDRQTVGDRHPLDPVLKAKTMERDGYTCQCCGFGEGSGASRVVAMSVLQSHHVISVSNSGPDSEDNIITICMVCHSLIHVCLKRGLKLGISKEDFDNMSDSEKSRFKKIYALARKDWEAGKRLGKNKDTISKENNNYSKFKMPGTDLAENQRAAKYAGN